jgi:two-component system, sensor histidine kinase and response regulator
MNHKNITGKKFLKRKFIHKRIHLYTTPVLVSGLIVSILISASTCSYVITQQRKEFHSTAGEIRQELVKRFESHALMLSAGTAYFAMSDTVSRNDWKNYFAHARIEKYLEDLQGIGYSMIVPPGQLEQHISRVREEGFQHYTVLPAYQREFYTTIVFVEPFTERNSGSLGYDMFTEPVKKRAMEFSRDFDLATLSGRFRPTVVDTGEEEIYGSLMFVPYYDPGLPAYTIEQRRAAIRGWLYSPYRLKTFMDKTLEHADPDKKIRVQICDELVSDSTLMYDNLIVGSKMRGPWGYYRLTMPVNFNENEWHLLFIQPRPFPFRAAITLLTGIVISILLYFLFVVFSKIERRSRQLTNRNKKLKTLNATKDKFFSIITHDLKTPYNAVLGFSEILMSNAGQMDTQEIQKVTGIINHSAKLAVDLLTNLVVWSQSHTGRIGFTPEKRDVVSHINETELLFTDVVRQKNIEIIKKLPVRAFAIADAEMLNIILRNLLSNAIKFTNPGGKVEISAEKKEHELVISVTDTGVGIEEVNTKKLFRIDESYSTTGTNKEKGTGLGLLLCKEFVEKHGGRIWVESKTYPESESGSTFYFTLPSAN